MCHDPGINEGLEPPEEDGLCSCPACLHALQEARQASTCFSDAIRALQVPPCARSNGCTRQGGCDRKNCLAWLGLLGPHNPLDGHKHTQVGDAGPSTILSILNARHTPMIAVFSREPLGSMLRNMLVYSDDSPVHACSARHSMRQQVMQFARLQEARSPIKHVQRSPAAAHFIA